MQIEYYPMYKKILEAIVDLIWPEICCI